VVALACSTRPCHFTRLANAPSSSLRLAGLSDPASTLPAKRFHFAGSSLVASSAAFSDFM